MNDKKGVPYTRDSLKKSAKNLAKQHCDAIKREQITPLKPILANSNEILRDAYKVLSALAKTGQELTSAEEWLIDNFYIIQEQLIEVEYDFPKEYQKSIPVIAKGDLSGLPRVYELVLSYLTYTDNLIDDEDLAFFIQNYQQEQTLEQGELWAIPIMIRLILIRKLSEKATRILQRKRVQRAVNDLISKIDITESREPGSVVALISSWFKNQKPVNSNVYALVELYKQLQQTGNLYEEEKRWFKYRIRQNDMLMEEALRIEAQKESRLHVSIQNAVISLRHSSETDWADFVEECSVIEKILRLDPSGHYADMDFQTRDNYRKAVERLSRRSNKSETEIAELVLLMVEEHTEERTDGQGRLFNDDVVKCHVGYFLAGEGYETLAKRVGYAMPLKESIHRILERQPGWYIFTVAIHTAILMAILWFATDSIGSPAGMSLAILAVSLFPALDLSVSAVNRFFAFFVPPRMLPKMDYEERIPDHSRTLVVVPTMFNSPENVKKQVENLEIRSLANPDPELQFLLLSDFTDSASEHTENDAAIIEAAKVSIKELNQKHSSTYGNRFHLLHRKRVWNEKEGVWIGWERKRGKLEEFNKLLLEAEAETGYEYTEGDFFESIKSPAVRFVITLDADTKLPPDSARHLIRTIAHPLNRPWYNPDEKRISKGYGIIQPRISIPPETSHQSWFSRIFSGNVGLDPYSTAVSDIYQDLAGEAVFTGKGIYDVQAFHYVLDNRFPENRILSHDLIESTYLRAGLATDIELFDDYPSTYISFSKRNHRWIRGDWQIAAWLFPRVPGQHGREKNTINALSRWKIFDNLRRSLNPFFLTLFFWAGWFFLPGSGWIWTAAAFGILAFPIYVSLYGDILNRPARVKWKLYVDKIRANLKINSLQSVFTVVILPHQAMVQLDAVVRTLYRLKISDKKLLEWTTASQVESNSPNSIGVYIKSNVISVIIAVGILGVSFTQFPHYLWIVVPFFVLWGGAPVYMWLISRPIETEKHPLTERDVDRLRIYARKTWFYFERFVNEEHFWLPPDNYQVDPPLPVTERTSPTNIGLALVSTQVAYNRGYITLSELLERLENTLQTMNRLERFNGHFYNWYDTHLGEVLNPRYISTVDSGNLAGGLIVIKEAVKKVMKTKGVNNNIWDGLKDTLTALIDIFEQYKDVEYMPGTCYENVMLHSNNMLELLKNRKSENAPGGLELLKLLKEDAASLCSINLMPLGSKLDDNTMRDLLYWVDSPLRLIEKAIIEFRALSFNVEFYTGTYSPLEIVELFENDEAESVPYKLACKWRKQADEIIHNCEKFLDEMDFSFLYIKKRGLFSIGYNVEKARLDEGTYDLLASEARISSYIAIAKGDVPVKHWFRLSRRLTSLSRNEILLSWGGTMFEYLMPLLFLRSYKGTLLDHTGRNVIEWQKDYGRNRGEPWGYSESAYGFLNIDMHYQYRAFGAPGLGLKRGLAEEYVVAPYASKLALMVEPKESLKNLKNLEKIGGFGLYGFYDAIDFTPGHLNEGENHKVVKTYMAHHHGMSLASIENLLNNNAIQDYFHSDPSIRGCELILQERIPRGVPIKEPHPIDAELEPGEQRTIQQIVEHAGIDELDASPPRLHILSNGDYSTFLTHAGTGTSRFNGVMLNGWERDPTTDPLGFFFYIKDMESGGYWSSMHQPVRRKPDRYDTWFHNGKIVTSRVDEWIETTTAVSVSPDYPIEIRKLTLTNYSQEVRTLEITSYAEAVLNREEDYKSHPAFSKLFVQTEYLAEHHSILVKRRPRSENESENWLVHTFSGPEMDNLTAPLEFETERSKFIGRGRNLTNPVTMDDDSRLQSTLGNVSDPIVSLRKKITLAPGEKKELSFGLGFTQSKEEAVKLADRFNNRHTADRTFDLADVYSTVELNHHGITSKEAHYFQKLASWILYPHASFRTDKQKLRENRKKQHDLWAYGISGDFPLIVFRIDHTDQLKQLKKLLKAHTFWRSKGIQTELLILNDHAPGYIDEVQESVFQVIESSMEQNIVNRNGGVFVHRTDKMPGDEINLLLTVAHVVFDSKLPDLSKPSRNTRETKSWVTKSEKETEDTSQKSSHTEENLQFFNGYGGFSKTGDEYHILIKKDPETGTAKLPPAPWINVIANPSFGFIASERGSGYTWSENSRENKLTQWSNDSVIDPPSEAFYIRDEEKEIFWSPTPGPAPGTGDYRTVHGFGYTRYEHNSEELEQHLVQFVPDKDAAKLSSLKIKNSGNEPRTLSVYRFLDRVLGVSRETSSRYVVQNAVDKGRTIVAENHYNNEFAGRAVFASVLQTPSNADLSFTTNREVFMGRNRTPECPVVPESGDDLDNDTTPGGDPCTAFRIRFTIPPGETVLISFLEGESADKVEALRLVEQYREPDRTEEELERVKKSWKERLSKISVSSPDAAMDLLLNGWLGYQNLVCRMWARTAFYQAGGAYGFRDQLQDALAALYIDPQLTRKQILLHAKHQFLEGDVLHWWHPPTGRGIRSKITDDRLWLPYVTAFYIEATGDKDLLDEEAAYITSQALEEHEHEKYIQPQISSVKESVYHHCCRAIDVTLKFGEHGLPLIGAGDWNDGMNRVGEQGKGESVWLGFFLYDVLTRFEKICRKKDDPEKAASYKKEAARLKKRLNNEGWDGEWYLRAYYDDGTPLGSSSNRECRIDAISQAWSVLTGAGESEKQVAALKAADEHLISREDNMIRLLYPPFDQTEKNPGYIKGYIPGVRENGGQYTHGALWLIKAFAQAGMGDKAGEYFRMINPINHSSDKWRAEKYKVEPYVAAADVYGEPPLNGMGGWTWYTGSGGWMYRVALESILGFRLVNGSFELHPCLPSDWPGFSMRYQADNKGTMYDISIENPENISRGKLSGELDGKTVSGTENGIRIRILNNGKTHHLKLKLER